MEGVAIAVVVFGPIVAVLLILFKAIRQQLMPKTVEIRPWRPQADEPPAGGDLAGDREPRRPVTPTRSGAISLAVPADDGGEPDQCGRRSIDRAAGAGTDEVQRRLAG